ncbi:MAG TPA: choice-of-anchor D domain-containing protein, partial [Polyangia bacterium]
VVNFAKLVISPSTATFATLVGVASSSIVFGVANAGDIATGAITARITGANAADFTISANSCLMLAPLSACSISVVFAPSYTSAATEAATLTVQDGGAGASAVKAALSGSVYEGPALAITSDRSDLGSVPIGTTGTATVFTVTNSGDAASGTLAASVSGPEFVIIGDTCTGVSLAKSASCIVSLALKPTTLGAKAATLKVGGNSGAAAVKSITGSGIS